MYNIIFYIRVVRGIDSSIQTIAFVYSAYYYVIFSYDIYVDTLTIIHLLTHQT
jgi:hypothetical protein